MLLLIYDRAGVLSKLTEQTSQDFGDEEWSSGWGAVVAVQSMWSSNWFRTYFCWAVPSNYGAHVHARSKFDTHMTFDLDSVHCQHFFPLCTENGGIFGLSFGEVFSDVRGALPSRCLGRGSARMSLG